MKLPLLGVLIFILVQLSAQRIRITSQSKLPNQLFESSGLISGTHNSVWTHNDSGGLPILYKLNSDGEITNTLKLIGVRNHDWEDLANDYQGFVYIADIGNNTNTRKQLQIYKIPHPDSLKTDSVIPGIISYEYENQIAFPPQPDQRNFDAEALIAYKDLLYIFTKNRTSPYSKYTYIYALANKAGHQKALLIDSLYLKGTKEYHSWITSASRSPDEDLVILLSHKKAWLIKDFRTSKNLKTIKTKVTGIYSQKEAICFDENNKLWVSNEKFNFLRAKLKKAILK